MICLGVAPLLMLDEWVNMLQSLASQAFQGPFDQACSKTRVEIVLYPMLVQNEKSQSQSQRPKATPTQTFQDASPHSELNKRIRAAMAKASVSSASAMRILVGPLWASDNKTGNSPHKLAKSRNLSQW